MVSINKNITIHLDFVDLAELFWGMSSSEMALFFNIIGNNRNDHALQSQFAMVDKSEFLNEAGRKAMKTIGEAVGMKEG